MENQPLFPDLDYKNFRILFTLFQIVCGVSPPCGLKVFTLIWLSLTQSHDLLRYLKSANNSGVCINFDCKKMPSFALSSY